MNELVKFTRADKTILHLLQSDAKLGIGELAEQAHLANSTCYRRVKRLESMGAIKGYVALVDQTSVGYPDDVFVQITLESQKREQLRKFERAVRGIPEVMECYLMSGESDYLLRVIVKDARDYEQLHSRMLTGLPGVARVHSAFALRTVVRRTEIQVRES